MKTSLIIGMGIGELYASVLDKLGHGIITVDSNPAKKADFLTVEAAIAECRLFDTVHICTPNFTHEILARTVAPVSRMVFIEKPGLQDAKCWQCLVEDFPRTRFMMVKNNMWRGNILELQTLASKAKTVNIDWIRRNCIPSPGSWFTNRELSYGGVSRDLMPHLLSLYIALNPVWHDEKVNGHFSIQRWKLDEIDSTEYGVVYPNGVHNVDDKCNIRLGSKWNLTADWRSMDTERSAITFTMQDNTVEVFELGWCPEDAYSNMIADAVANWDNQEFWSKQYNQDFWIHTQIEKL